MKPATSSRGATSLLVLGLLLAACHTAETGGNPAAGAGQPALGSFGFDTAGMDRSVAPGDDFFAFANGTWVRNTEIPADRSGCNSFSVLTERALLRTRALVDAALADTSASGDRRKIADCYRAFMDASGIEARGLAPLQPALAAIAAIRDAPGLARALGGTLRADVDLLNSTNFYTPHLFGLWVAQHLDRPAECAPYLVQGGLGMPDRDFYLEGGRMAELRAQYQAHIARMLGLAGIADGDAKAGRIVALETAIATVHASQVDTNDVKKGANYWPRADFAHKAPGLDWAEFFTAAELGSQAEFIVWQPAAVTGIAQLVASTPLDTWKEYLTFHALEAAAPLLPRAFADEHFAFQGTALNGTPQQSDRWKRGIAAVNEALGEAVGRLYAEQHFSAATKARADAMVRNLIAAFGKRIAALPWMSPTTKAQATAKLAGLRVGMGYPDQWRDYAALEIRADDPVGNAERASRCEYRRNLAKLGKPADRGEWYLLPQEVNALNIPLENRLLFPAAILEAPFFDPAADDAVNYGAIGAVIGHEITHSFDSSGALFDAHGRLANWWTAEDLKQFDAAGAALAAQYDAYRPFPDLAVNGTLTLAENIADVAGLATALDAYQLAQAGTAPQLLEGFTPVQRFFLGWAQAWRSKYRERALRNRVLTDVHAPGQFRSETVRNQDAWYQAFEVRPGQARHLPPEQRVKVW